MLIGAGSNLDNISAYSDPGFPVWTLACIIGIKQGISWIHKHINQSINQSTNQPNKVRQIDWLRNMDRMSSYVWLRNTDCLSNYVWLRNMDWMSYYDW